MAGEAEEKIADSVEAVAEAQVAQAEAQVDVAQAVETHVLAETAETAVAAANAAAALAHANAAAAEMEAAGEIRDNEEKLLWLETQLEEQRALSAAQAEMITGMQAQIATIPEQLAALSHQITSLTPQHSTEQQPEGMEVQVVNPPAESAKASAEENQEQKPHKKRVWI